MFNMILLVRIIVLCIILVSWNLVFLIVCISCLVVFGLVMLLVIILIWLLEVFSFVIVVVILLLGVECLLRIISFVFCLVS